MSTMLEEQDIEIISLIEKLRPAPERYASDAVTGKAKFLAEAQTYPLPLTQRLNGQPKDWKTVFSRKMQPRLAVIPILMVIFLLVFMGTGVTVFAAQSSLPDQPLYSIKLASEDVRTGLATNNQTRLDLATSLADTRLDEILQLAAQGKNIPLSVWDRLAAQYDLALSTAALSDDAQLNRDLLQIQARIAVNLEKLSGLSANSQYNGAAMQTLAALQNDLQLIGAGLQDPAAFRQRMGAGPHNQGWQLTPSVPSASGTPQATLQSRTPMWRATDDHGGYMMTPWTNSTANPQYPKLTPVPGNNNWNGSPTQMPTNQWHNDCQNCGQWNGSNSGGQNGGSWGGGGMGGGHH